LQTSGFDCNSVVESNNIIVKEVIVFSAIVDLSISCYTTLPGLAALTM